jgi:Flp pilus assembly protein TadG
VSSTQACRLGLPDHSLRWDRVDQEVCVRSNRTSRGAAAVEFALLVPFLLMLLLGVIDFGFMLNREGVLNNASREAVRVASVGGSKAEVTAAVTSFLKGWPGAVTVTVSCVKPTGTPCGSYDADAASGGTAIVRVEYKHPWVTPVGPMFGGNTITIVKTSQMRIE